jgi:Rrf2 family protein
VKYLEQIVSSLSKGGFLKSIRGPQGGYKLNRRPDEYKVGDIIRLTEGSLAPVACLEDERNQCDRCAECATIEFWEGLNNLVNDYINSYTLADLIRNKQAKAGNDYCI